MVVFSHVGWVAGSVAQYLIPFIFVLTAVVFFHELGHFLIGRLCGVKIDSFSIGFGPELFAFVDRGGTRWRVAAIPLGGYVKFHGDLNAASVPDPQALASMSRAERDVSFAGQPVWKRAAIVAAGPMASFLFAIAVFSATIFVSGQRILLPRVQVVPLACPELATSLPARPDFAALDTPLYASTQDYQLAQNSAAEIAGFKPGDLVVSIDGKPIETFFDIQSIVSMSADAALTFEVQRGGSLVRLQATPRRAVVSTPFGKQREARLGIQASDDPADVRIERVGPVGAVALGTKKTWQILDVTATFLGRLFVGREAANQVSGPIGIAAMSGEMAKLGFDTLLNWAAILSASIGFFNLLPIPLLDGGHLLYFGIEAARGRPLSLRAQEVGFRIGLAIVALLMVFATSNDLIRYIPKIFGFTG
ncbi:MAG: RIP metalloprotease RseP [Methylobacteriaceae bacterium]|nr:RIP metalloprotease RseP [Methylobacteriaceae bacterium]MBV9636730.1 RIP metalloprotease RseP [Methylobacteriaceae bacterium]MBV9703728.1 RIP metalloprotease RseP [Methylobacteriaceae bacterium]